MGKYRKGRIGGEIKKVIADMLLRELKDPRLESCMVSVTEVNAAKDGSFATVYLSVFCNSDEDKAAREADVLAAMESAKGTIRHAIGKAVKLRNVPDLQFKLDQSLDYGMHMDEVLSKISKGDD